MLPIVRRTPDGGFVVVEEIEGDFEYTTQTTTFSTRDQVACYLKGRSGGFEQVEACLDETEPKGEAEVTAFELGLSRVLGIECVTTEEWRTAEETFRQLGSQLGVRLGLSDLIRILRAIPR